MSSENIYCENGCGNIATHFFKSTKRWCCANHQRRCPSIVSKTKNTCVAKYGGVAPANSKNVRDKMVATLISSYGCDNASKSVIIKDRKRSTLLKNYGVKSPLEIKNNASVAGYISAEKKKTALLEKITELSIKNSLSKNEYIKTCRRFSDYMYRLYKDNIDPGGVRGKEWHLDHKYSILAGYVNQIPFWIVGHICNLQLVPVKENLAKSSDCSLNAEDLLLLYEQSSAFKIHS